MKPNTESTGLWLKRAVLRQQYPPLQVNTLVKLAEGEEPLTPESIIEGDAGGYDLIAIFEGHLSPVFMG